MSPNGPSNFKGDELQSCVNGTSVVCMNEGPKGSGRRFFNAREETWRTDEATGDEML